MSYKESEFEQAVLELMRDKLGYEYAYGPDVPRDYHSPLYEDMLQSSLQDINPELPQEALDEAVYKLKNYQVRGLIQKNEVFMDYLQNGIEVGYMKQGEQKYAHVKLIDYDHLNQNSFYAVNQWTVVENSTKRPDVVIFVNGLPLVVVELKSCSREETDVSDAYRQLRNYMKEIPSLFTYNAFCIMSDLVTSKAGTLTAGEDRYMEWKTADGDYEETRYAKYDTLFEGMLEKHRLLDLLKNFVLYSKDEEGDRKILAAYHQYFAVKKAVESTKRATETDGKAGVFWHTQGSGKSLSMVFYAKLLQSTLESPTIVVITDRNDLDDQLFGQFAKCSEFLRQTPVQATCRKLSEEYKEAVRNGVKRKIEIGVKDYLQDRAANGIIFTTMQKFEEVGEPLSERRNIIVMADEAHRSQYSLDEKIDGKTGKVTRGFARLVRDSLPNAAFIGFTGTPIQEKDRSTREVFGNYIDIYDMTQSVADGATRPVYYESRVINLKLNTEVLHEIDEAYDVMAQNADGYAIEKSKQQLGRMESILGAPQTIDALCRDIIAHYEDRQDLLTGKALVVAYSRTIAMKIYRKILELRPGWTEKVKVVMTSGNNDPEEWHDIIGNKSYRKELAKKFKDDGDSMKIAVVVDMWLTGFDVPSLATMYLYKPMAGHNLMQAIARVNRVFQDKEGGLIVDYVGIARALKQAMNVYTVRDRKNYGDPDISKAALPKFLEKLEVCEDLFHGFDFSKFLTGSELERATAITDGINFVLADGRKKEIFSKEAMLLRQAQSLCRSLLSKEQRFEAAFFEAVRIAITKITTGRKLSLKEINSRINELLKQSIKSEGVINLFKDTKQELNLFNPEFLNEIAQMKQKNLAAELLRRLVSEQVTAYKKTNVVQAELFSERLQKLMNAYRNGQISNAEVIDELMKMANDISENRKAGNDMGLSAEEKAFYDALTRPRAIKDFYTNDVLVQMTKELTDLLRKNQTIDWQKKETARAGMRRMVKHLLKKYKYPPDGVESATETVIEQCEMWTDNQ